MIYFGFRILLGLYYRPSLPFSISPKEILPLPRVIGPRPQNKHDRRRGKTAIITGSPYKFELEEERERKERERTQKPKKGSAKTRLLNVPKRKQTRRKRKLSGDAKQADKVKNVTLNL